MADNLSQRYSASDSNTAGPIAFDECSINGVTVLVARGKIGFGADSEYTEVAIGAGFPVQPATAATFPVSGTFWQATQPVSIAATVTVDSELPAAAALADGAANPTAPAVGASLLVFNGTTWDRGRGDTTNGIDVDVTRVSGNVTVIGTGTFAVQAAQSGTWTVQPGNTANTTPWLVSERPATSGGVTPHRTISAASTNLTSVKGSVGQVYNLQVFNVNAAARYLKLYNKASAPNLATDTPVKTISIPGNTAVGGVVLNWPLGLEFTTGIAFALTTAIADADTGAVAANEIVVNIDYK